MARSNKRTIFILRDPAKKFKGWGWVDVDLGVAERFNLFNEYPLAIFLTPEEHEELQANGINCPYMIAPSPRGRSGGKKFVVNTSDELINLSVQKSLTIEAVCGWVKTWASCDAKIITPGNRTISLAGESVAKDSAFVYFVLNTDSNAIKIGKAKDLDKRLKALQTISSTQLQLLRAIQVIGEKEARQLELSLHQKFVHLRLNGEWFKAERELFSYIEDLRR